MEVYKLHTNFDWDSIHGNPWDLSNANVDLSMRCFPTRRLHVPLQYVQTDEHHRGYSVGVEYHYHLFNRLKKGSDDEDGDGGEDQQSPRSFVNHAFYDFYYDDDDVEEMQQEQEDDFQYEWNAFHGEFYKQYHGNSSNGGDNGNGSANGNDNASAENFEQRQQFHARYMHPQHQQHHHHHHHHQQQQQQNERQQHMGHMFDENGAKSFYPALAMHAFAPQAETVVQRPRKIKRFDSGGAEVIVEDLLGDASGIVADYHISNKKTDGLATIKRLPLDDAPGHSQSHTLWKSPLSSLLPALARGNHHLWERVVDILDLKFVQGVFKFHLQRPLEANDSQQLLFRDEESQRLYSQIVAMSPKYLLDKDHDGIALEKDMSVFSRMRRLWNSLPQIVIMNYLSTLFGRNKISANIGINTKLRTWTSKLIMRRKFYFLKPLLNISRPLYLAASVVNPLHPEKNRIAGVSASIRGFSLQAKRLGRRNAIEFSKRGYWTPFSNSMKNTLLQVWRKKYEQEELMVLPPPPQFDSESPDGLMRNIVHQLSKVFRYFIDLQMAALHHTWQHLYPFRWEKYKSFALSRVFEQLYLLSLGCRSRVAFEYSWRRDRTLQLLRGFRVPIEFNWGCDIFRIWVFLDLISEVTARATQWKHQHSCTIAVTLFDVYTLFSFTLSLHPLYRKLVSWLLWLKNKVLGAKDLTKKPKQSGMTGNKRRREKRKMPLLSPTGESGE